MANGSIFDEPYLEKYGHELARHGLYIALGGTMVATNGLLTATILRHVALRDMKEYLVIAAMAFADCISGLATALAGGIRIYLRLAGLADLCVSRLFCLFQPHNFIWSCSDMLQAFMLLSVALDRLLIVGFPVTYIGWDRRCAAALILPVYVGSTLQAAYFIFITWNDTSPKQRSICFTTDAFEPQAHAMRKSARVAAVFGSILAYSLVLLLYRRRIAKAIRKSEHSPDNQKAKLRFQRRLTAATGISCLFTFVFYILPQILTIIGLYNNIKSLYVTYNSWAWIFANVNPLINLLIYIRRMKDIRIGFVALLKNKTLPPSTDLWHSVDKKKIDLVQKRLKHMPGFTRTVQPRIPSAANNENNG